MLYPSKQRLVIWSWNFQEKHLPPKEPFWEDSKLVPWWAAHSEWKNEWNFHFPGVKWITFKVHFKFKNKPGIYSLICSIVDATDENGFPTLWILSDLLLRYFTSQVRWRSNWLDLCFQRTGPVGDLRSYFCPANVTWARKSLTFCLKLATEWLEVSPCTLFPVYSSSQGWLPGECFFVFISLEQLFQPPNGLSLVRAANGRNKKAAGNKWHRKHSHHKTQSLSPSFFLQFKLFFNFPSKCRVNRGETHHF